MQLQEKEELECRHLSTLVCCITGLLLDAVNSAYRNAGRHYRDTIKDKAAVLYTTEEKMQKIW